MHPTIKRLAECPEELTLAEVAYVLAKGRDFVNRAVREGRISALAPLGEGDGKNHRYTIARADLLAYIVRATTGDRRALMEGIRIHFPDLVEWCGAVAAGGSPALPGVRRRLPRADPTAWHPAQLALFPDHPNPQ